MKFDNNLPLQLKRCESFGVPMFAPLSGVCPFCKGKIMDTGDYYITGCPWCNRSWCE